MKRTIFLFCLLYNSIAFSQEKSDVDTLFTNDGKSYPGKMLRMVDDANIEFITQDSVVHKVPVTFIKELKKVGTVIAFASPPNEKEEMETVNNLFWQNPKIPSYIKNKHNTGIILTSIGSAFLAVGSVLIATNSSNVRTVNNQYQSGVYFSGVTALGFIMDLSGLPMAIVGIVKLSRSQKQAEYYLRSKGL